MLQHAVRFHITIRKWKFELTQDIQNFLWIMEESGDRKFITRAQVPLLSKFASANKDQWGFKMNETDFQVKLRLWMQSQVQGSQDS